MHILSFTAALLLLLLTPGPTNTLMMLAGYERGWRSSLRLIGAELTGYLAVVLTVLLVLAPAFAAYPSMLLWVRGAAFLWVLFLSWRLWGASARSLAANGELSGRHVLLTTVLNPKAPIIALVIMPQVELNAALPWLVLLSAFIVLAASFWLLVGAVSARGGSGRLTNGTIRKLAATGMFGFAVMLAASSVNAMV